MQLLECSFYLEGRVEAAQPLRALQADDVRPVAGDHPLQQRPGQRVPLLQLALPNGVVRGVSVSWCVDSLLTFRSRWSEELTICCTEGKQPNTCGVRKGSGESNYATAH